MGMRTAFSVGILVFLAISVNIQALSTDLLGNTDYCIYNPVTDLDYCEAEYQIEGVGLDQNDVSFIFKDDRGSEFSQEHGGLSLNEYEFEIEPGKLKVKISGWKNPFYNIDHVLCYSGDCFYQYAWWNSSYRFKYELNGTSYGSANVTGYWLVNDTYGVNFGDGDQLFRCNYTVPTVTAIAGYLYYNSSTVFACVNSDENERVAMIMDQTSNESEWLEAEDDLVAWWTFGTDCDATSCPDSGQHGNTLTKSGVGQPADAHGQIGLCQDFADSSTMSIADNDKIDITTGITMMGWIWWDETSSPYTAVLDKSGNYFMYINSNTDDAIYTEYWYDASNRNRIDSSTAIAKNQWVHLAVTHTGVNGEMTFYVNGVNQSETVVDNANARNLGNTLYVGRSGGTLRLNGSLDDWKIYNRSLSSDEVMADYNNSAGGHNFLIIGSAPINWTAPIIQNRTLNFTATYCHDADYLYIRARDVADNGSMVFNEYLEFCQYGCSNITFWNLGNPGCIESGFLQAIFITVFALVFFGLVVWVLKR